MNTPAENTTLERSPIFENAGTFPQREPQHHSLGDVPIVSADNHICLGGADFWYDNAPSRLKDRVPRVRFDEAKGHWETEMNGQSLYPAGGDALVKTMETRRGGWNVEERVADLDAEGIAKEIAFPQNLLRLVHLKDLEAREYIFREYNRYLSSLQARAPGRFYGVGVANYWDPSKAREAVFEAASLGLKALILPSRPGDAPNGDKLYYSSDRLKPLWEAVEETGIAICFHILEASIYTGPGATAVNVMMNLAGLDFPQAWSELVYGGVFDRHPSLRVAFVEAGIHWIPGLLQNAEILNACFRPLLEYTPKLQPREYWERNCAATFMHDPAGLRQIDVIGVDNVMWSVDYPHNEGTFGYTGSAIDYVVQAVGPEAAGKILGTNALRFFRLD